MKHAKEYGVRFERSEPRWWHVSVPSIPGCHTQARTIEQGRQRIREALGLFADDADTAILVEEIRLPRAARVALDRAVRARSQAESLAVTTAEATRQAVAALTGSDGMSLRDAAALLGISHQRVAQLTKG